MDADTSEKIRDVISFVHSKTLSIGVYAPGDISVTSMYEEAASDLAEIIRTEKLKLLNEVRRLQKSYLSELTSNDDDSDYDDFIASYFAALAKLEAEL